MGNFKEISKSSKSPYLLGKQGLTKRHLVPFIYKSKSSSEIALTFILPFGKWSLKHKFFFKNLELLIT